MSFRAMELALKEICEETILQGQEDDDWGSLLIYHPCNMHSRWMALESEVLPGSESNPLLFDFWCLLDHWCKPQSLHCLTEFWSDCLWTEKSVTEETTEPLWAPGCYSGANFSLAWQIGVYWAHLTDHREEGFTQFHRWSDDPAQQGKFSLALKAHAVIQSLCNPCCQDVELQQPGVKLSIWANIRPRTRIQKWMVG